MNRSANNKLWLLAVLGAGLISAGWIIEGAKGYLPGLFANLGTAALLGVVFVVLQAQLGSRIEEVGEQAGATQTDVRALRQDVESLQDLTPQTMARVQGARAAFSSDLDALRQEVTFDRMRSLFERGERLSSFSRHGVRVGMANGDRLTWRMLTAVSQDGPSEPAIWIGVEDIGGNRAHSMVIWSAGEPLSDVIARLAASMQEAGNYPGDEVLDPTKLVGDLLETFEVAFRARTNAAGSTGIGGVVELLNQQWLLTDLGLDRIGHPHEHLSVKELGDQVALDAIIEREPDPVERKRLTQAIGAGVAYHGKTKFGEMTRSPRMFPRIGRA